jgi:hypothetical protein
MQVVATSIVGLGAMPSQSKMSFKGCFVFGETHISIDAKHLKSINAVMGVKLVFELFAKGLDLVF